MGGFIMFMAENAEKRENKKLVGVLSGSKG